jgi:hypothetical protein
MTADASCSQEYCYYPDTSCQLGNTDNCPHFTNQPAEQHDTHSSLAEGRRLAWTGMAMGHIDLAYVAGKKKPFVVGIVGPENAGKTSLLGAWYLLIGKGLLREADRTFAGSRTLEGWETLANRLRWSNSKTPPAFPAHTASHSGRVPGLLHLTASDDANSMTDYLFTDAPGEWFNNWANNVESTQAEGARWIANNADVLLIIADSEALVGTNKGNARHELQLLINRVASVCQNRPVALVWTKSDVSVDAGMRDAVQQMLKRHLPDAPSFTINIVDGDTKLAKTALFELLHWSLNCSRTKTAIQSIQASSQDPLFLFGSR